MSILEKALAMGLCLMICALMCAGQSDTDKIVAGKAWEGLVNAKGGREKLYSVKTLLSDFDSGSMVRLDVIPGFVWEFTGPFYGSSGARIVDRKRDILVMANTKGIIDSRQTFDRDQFLEYRFVFLLETHDYKPVPLRIRRSTGKPVLDVLEVILGKTRLDVFFEPEEMLVTRIDALNPKGGIVYSYSLLDYRLMDGIKMPMRVGVEFNPKDSLKIKYYYGKMQYRFNVDYDPNIFVAPEKSITPDGWKPKPAKEKEL